jgi:branched-chain amino acid transport system substrate-binding protein
MTRRGSSRRLFVAGLAGLLAAGLGMGAPGAQAQDKKEIVIGYTISQTGRFSTEALDVQRGYDLWRDQVNAQGGIMVKDQGRKLPVRFVTYDDKSDASTAGKLYERLITVDKVDLLLSPWGSGINFAVTAVTEKHGHPLVLTSASSDGVYARGFKRIFLAAELASRDAMPLTDYIVSMKDQIKTVAVLYENFIFSETVYNSFAKLLEGKGPQIVMAEKYPLGGQSFLSLLAKAKSLNPDAVIAFNLMPASIYITRQMREVGLRPKFYYVLIGPMFKEFMEGLGDLAEGVIEHGYWHPALPVPGARQFAETFEKAFNRPPSTDAAHAYIATAVVQQAIEKAGTLNRDTLTEVMHREEFKTIAGPYKYDEAGRNVLEKQFFVQVQGGKRLIVWPKEIAEAPVRFPVFGK